MHRSDSTMPRRSVLLLSPPGERNFGDVDVAGTSRLSRFPEDSGVGMKDGEGGRAGLRCLMPRRRLAVRE